MKFGPVAHVCLALLLVLLGPAARWPQPAARAGTPPASAAPPATALATSPVTQLVAAMIRRQIPHSYEDTSQWGKTAERWDGLHVQLDGLQLKTKRRRKTVKHGDWRMYRIDLADPNQPLRLMNATIRPADGGRVGFSVTVSAPLRAVGRAAKWVKGVQLYSLSAEALAHVTLKAEGDMRLVLNPTKVPPDVGIAPRVTRAELQLDQFRVYRVSRVGGELGQQLGRAMEGIVRRELARNNQRLAQRLNEQIEKNQDRFRLSLHDLLASRWAEVAEQIQRQSTAQPQRPAAATP